jgi:hypothetical protein
VFGEQVFANDGLRRVRRKGRKNAKTAVIEK